MNNRNNSRPARAPSAKTPRGLSNLKPIGSGERQSNTNTYSITKNTSTPVGTRVEPPSRIVHDPLFTPNSHHKTQVFSDPTLGKS